jgi:hypothetical protein
MTTLWEKVRTLASIPALAVTFLALTPGMSAAAEWNIETVDTTGTAQFTSLKIDRDGNVHVAYVADDDSHTLRYAIWDHQLKKWFTMPVAPQASFCTLVLDSKQYPHISYADFGTGLGAKLRHAYWDGSKWHLMPIDVDPGAVVAYYTSIALDANDNPFFSFYDYADRTNTFRLRLRSVFWMGSYWQALTVDREGGSGKFNSIAIDSQGHPQIAYANVRYESSSLRYAAWNGTEWKRERIEGSPGRPFPVYSVSMVLDKNDSPHIAYTDMVRGVLKYATKAGGTWRTQPIDFIADSYPDRDGITVDGEGNPYLTYHDKKRGTLKLASRQNGKWMIELVDEGFVGYTSSPAIYQDTLWISYADENGHSLKIARRPLTASSVLTHQGETELSKTAR